MQETLIRRGGQIRTDDLHIPNVARYRATLHPEAQKILRVQIYNYFKSNKL